MSVPIQCDAALSQRVLDAVRAAIPPNAAQAYHLPHAGLKNNPLLVQLLAMLDATRAVASAVADNAWDDCHPIPADIAEELQKISTRISSEIDTASKSPDRSCWETAECPT